jgi:hypothetical protein
MCPACAGLCTTGSSVPLAVAAPLQGRGRAQRAAAGTGQGNLYRGFHVLTRNIYVKYTHLEVDRWLPSYLSALMHPTAMRVC